MTIVDFSGLGQLFMIEASHVRKIRNKAKTKPKAAHRPLALSEEQELLIIQFIRHVLASGNYVTQRDVLNFSGKLCKQSHVSLDGFLLAAPQ
jgi:hypothetical protein